MYLIKVHTQASTRYIQSKSLKPVQFVCLAASPSTAVISVRDPNPQVRQTGCSDSCLKWTSHVPRETQTMQNSYRFLAYNMMENIENVA